MTEITVAALQLAFSADMDANIAHVTELVREAAAKGAHVVLPPELFEGEYFCRVEDEALFANARPVGEHKAVLAMQRLAAELGVTIPTSFFEADGPHHYNSLAMIGPDGAVMGVYRKSHIPDGPGYEEKFYFRPGNTGFKVWPGQFGGGAAALGVGVCWDQWYPEAARAMMLMGAEILFYPTAIGSEPHDAELDTSRLWRRAMIGHAVSNVVPVVAANRIGTEGLEHGAGQHFYGHSFITDERGDIIAEFGAEETGVLVATIDLDRVKRHRAAFGFSGIAGRISMEGWSRMFRLVAVAAALALMPTGAAAQNKPQIPPGEERQATASSDSSPDDILVEGLRERKQQPTFVQAPAATSTIANRKKFEFSQRIAACAARSKLSDLKRLRDVVDGAFNSSTQALAQDRLKRIYISCSEGAALLSFTTDGTLPRADADALTGGASFSSSGAPVIDSAPLGHSIYDRGAFVIAALQQFAPDLVLTRDETEDQAVQSRFNLREVPRNRFRLIADYRYFEVAVCMVRLEPRLAVRLAMNDTRAKIDGVQATLINRARRCVGNAKRVQADPVQFRLYIADAVYRWAVAARNVDTLIPLTKVARN